MRKIFLCSLVILSVGCSTTDRWLRPPVLIQPVTTPTQDDLSKTTCAEGPESNAQKKGKTTNDGCLYYTVRVNMQKSITREDRDNLIAYLIYLANNNCENFLSRAFANRSGLEAGRNVSKDLSTGLAAGTAYALPAVSVGFGFANLVSGSVTDNLDNTYYVKETFGALKSALETTRETQHDAILKKQVDSNGTPYTIDQYTLMQAVSDLSSYDHLCSFDNAVTALQQATAQQQQDATKHRIDTQMKAIQKTQASNAPPTTESTGGSVH